MLLQYLHRLYNYHLLQNAQAINTGTNLVLPTVFEDLDNVPRPQGSEFDIGCYEYSNVTSVSDKPVPESFKLFQNYPNPFNPTTRIEFQLANSGFVSLKIFNVLGNEVATLIYEEMSSGKYDFEFNAEELTSGIYFARLQQNSSVQTIKMTLLR